MDRDTIKNIGIDEEGRLYVSPDSKSFPMIYREAVEVHWNKEMTYLYSPKPRKWTYVKWFKQIVSAAQMQDVHLVLTENTDWINIPEELEIEIKVVTENES
jgi:hypothetical protein